MALASASTFSGSVVRTPSGGRGLPKVCCQRTWRLGHLCNQCSRVWGSFLHSGHVGSAAGSSRWAYALRSGVCPARTRARRTAPALLEEVMQSAFQEKCSYALLICAQWGRWPLPSREPGAGRRSLLCWWRSAHPHKLWTCGLSQGQRGLLLWLPWQRLLQWFSLLQIRRCILCGGPSFPELTANLGLLC